MQGKEAHLSDEELLLFSDQELPTRHATRAREHVAQCEACRKRLTELENASADFLDLHEQEIQAQSSHLGNSRNLLKARLSEASSRVSRSRRATFRRVVVQQLARACLSLLLVVGGTWTVRYIVRARSNSDAMKADAIALPRSTLTPGSTRAVQVADLCSNQDLDNDPPVNPSLEQAVFNEYGVPALSKKNYALDYLITPALGGADNIQNLWPQPYSSTWNARVKDQLEDHLHELVCQGKVKLATAQNDIASDWIAAYKRYFNTDKPEPNSSPASSVPPEHELDRVTVSIPESRISAIYDLALAVPNWQLPAARTVLRRAEQLR
jgi:anti-sigma factor RsiW